MHTYELAEIRTAYINDIIETLIEKGYKRNGDVPLYGKEHFWVMYNHSHDKDIADYIHIDETTFSILLCNGIEITTSDLGMDDLISLRDAVETSVEDAEKKKW